MLPGGLGEKGRLLNDAPAFAAAWPGVAHPLDDVRYTGVDRVDWRYRAGGDLDDVEYLQVDLDAGFDLNDMQTNILTFPKSIGEFSLKARDELKAYL